MVHGVQVGDVSVVCVLLTRQLSEDVTLQHSGGTAICCHVTMTLKHGGITGVVYCHTYMMPTLRISLTFDLNMIALKLLTKQM